VSIRQEMSVLSQAQTLPDVQDLKGSALKSVGGALKELMPDDAVQAGLRFLGGAAEMAGKCC